ncbi:hypothetical protein EYF80_031385 [Liparis tanakae]|uniref:Uncharacterized protein n=1 Tax=Liparis tanakae TaxID=230148 RepID=A0A4Z2H0L3_9TELE|nr:hypothetical protein EYF80_031385 [Liparis tanakae]
MRKEETRHMQNGLLEQSGFITDDSYLLLLKPKQMRMGFLNTTVHQKSCSTSHPDVKPPPPVSGLLGRTFVYAQHEGQTQRSGPEARSLHAGRKNAAPAWCSTLTAIFLYVEVAVCQ